MPEMLNVFNEQGVWNPDTTVRRLSTFNPFTATPRECPQGQTNCTGYNWQKGPNFGKPVAQGGLPAAAHVPLVRRRPLLTTTIAPRTGGAPLSSGAPLSPTSHNARQWVPARSVATPGVQVCGCFVHEIGPQYPSLL